MAVRLYTGRHFLVGMLAVLCLPSLSMAEEQAGHDRWVPSLAATSGLSLVGLDGAVESFDSMGNVLRPAAEGRDLDVSPLVGVDLEIMTPQLGLKLSPRFFLSGEVSADLTRSRNLAREGSATGAEGPPLPFPPGQTLPGTGFPEEAFRGLGSVATARLQTLNFGAGLGFAIPFEWLDRQMRVKASAEYLSFEVQYDGAVTDGKCLPTGTTTQCVTFDPPAPPPPPPPFPPGPDPPLVPGYTRSIELSASTTTRYHSIGPAIELEMETGEVGSFTHSLYFGLRGYRILGDRAARSTFLTDSETYNDPIGTETYTANWEYKIDRWMYRFAMGLRFSFTGP